MKYVIRLMICAIFIMTLSGCKSAENNIGRNIDGTVNITSEFSGDKHNSLETRKEKDEEISMKLFINDKEIPVTWETNDSVNELVEEINGSEIVVEMSMYSDNEQVGYLGKKYSSNDKQTTTHNGDIVLYNSSNIVVFYGSNTWSYTRLGKMNLSEQEVEDLLANGDVIIKLTK